VLFNTIHISAGAFDCGPPVDFNCTFSFELIPPPTRQLRRHQDPHRHLDLGPVRGPDRSPTAGSNQSMSQSTGRANALCLAQAHAGAVGNAHRVATIERPATPSPDEFPTPRNLAVSVYGLNDRLARVPCRRPLARDSDDVLLANFSACAVLTPNGNFCVVQPNTVCRISHHFGPTGISALTVPALFPLASTSAI